jgi:UDP-N-acetylmuramoyl-tripeptide--D-alanyl-D-alanine ligase
MPLFTLQEVRRVIGARSPFEADLKKGPAVRRVCTDSRDVRPGDLFIALKGDHFDGHAFVEKAIRQGAVAAVVNETFQLSSPKTGGAVPRLLPVPDPLVAYQDLAAAHRRRFEIPVVAVTGSNGKTTTKEMVARVLAERWTTLKTEANFNNQIGVPQTLLRLSARHQAAAIEMGVDAPGQTTRLAEITHPTVGLITNIGPDHLEFFGTLEISAASKGELLDFLPKDGVAVLNADDAFFPSLVARAHCPVVSFGLSKTAQVRADQISSGGGGTSFRLLIPGQRRGAPVRLRTHGSHNVLNALAAVAVGHGLGLTTTAIVRGLSKFRPATMRSEVHRLRDMTVINDCYNANPASMRAAIDLLVGLQVGHRTIAVLGDMLELGVSAEALHREVGRHVAAQGVSELIACGTLGRKISEGAIAAGMAAARIHDTADAMEAVGIVTNLVRAGDVVLVKGSRGMRMERVVDALKHRNGLRRVH